MNTKQITQYLRNHNSPRANFARWLNQPLWWRLKTFRESKASNYGWPKALTIDGPELSEDGTVLWNYSPAEITLCDDRNSGLSRVLNHTGWFTDNWQEETLQPAVAVIPEFRKLVFPATVPSDFNNQKILLDEWEEVDFTNCEGDGEAYDARYKTMCSVLHRADSIAENEAEAEREYRMKDEAENRATEALEERKEIGASLRNLIQALRDSSNLPAIICEELRGNVRAYLAQRQALLEEAKELREDPYKILPEY